MTAGDLALFALGIATAAIGAWALWPRRRLRAGPKNNWQQRSATDTGSGKTDSTASNGSSEYESWAHYGTDPDGH